MTGSRPPIMPLSFLFQPPVKAPEGQFPNFSAPSCPNVSERGNGMMSRPRHFDRDKANLLYFSLGSESVVVSFANYRSMRCDYRACASKLCMLTYRFYVLSNPVSPVSFPLKVAAKLLPFLLMTKYLWLKKLKSDKIASISRWVPSNCRSGMVSWEGSCRRRGYRGESRGSHSAPPPD